MKELIPISICAIMPIMIIFLLMWAQRNKDNKRAEVIIEACRAKGDVDIDQLQQALGRKELSPARLLQRRLLIGCLCSFSGIGLLLTGLLLSFSEDNEIYDLWFMMLAGFILTAIGISYYIVYRMQSRMMRDGMDAESCD